MRQSPDAAFERFASWVESTGWTPMQAAYRLGCDRSYLGLLLKRKRVPGLRIAVAIERATGEWPGGPIKAAEWVPEEVPVSLAQAS